MNNTTATPTEALFAFFDERYDDRWTLADIVEYSKPEAVEEMERLAAAANFTLPSYDTPIWEVVLSLPEGS